jgi:sugar/nucleoside kinase (ribokinase family)
MEIAKSLEYASAAAVLTVTKKGTIEAMPRRDQIVNLM